MLSDEKLNLIKYILNLKNNDPEAEDKKWFSDFHLKIIGEAYAYELCRKINQLDLSMDAKFEWDEVNQMPQFQVKKIGAGAYPLFHSDDYKDETRAEWDDSQEKHMSHIKKRFNL